MQSFAEFMRQKAEKTQQIAFPAILLLVVIIVCLLLSSVENPIWFSQSQFARKKLMSAKEGL